MTGRKLVKLVPAQEIALLALPSGPTCTQDCIGQCKLKKEAASVHTERFLSEAFTGGVVHSQNIEIARTTSSAPGLCKGMHAATRKLWNSMRTLET